MSREIRNWAGFQKKIVETGIALLRDWELLPE